jgi:ABC-type enterochelin transport system permease subunit
MPDSMVEKVKRFIGQVTELGLLLIALAIVLDILTTGTLPFFGGVVGELIALIQTLGDNGVVGLIAVAIILWLFAKRNPG